MCGKRVLRIGADPFVWRGQKLPVVVLAREQMGLQTRARSPQVGALPGAFIVWRVCAEPALKTLTEEVL